MAKIQTGLFLIGIGIGMIANNVIPIPNELGFIKQMVWLIFIIIGTVFIINSSG
jgi:hypothetical protein